MNIFPDKELFIQELENSAKKKNLYVFENEGSYYVLDESTGYVTDSYTLSGAASFINRFIADRMRTGM